MPAFVMEAVNKQLQSNKRSYSKNLKAFALILQFYFSKAYNYVREKWSNLLPHPSTLKKWYRVVNRAPGFTDESFEALRQRNEIIKQRGQKLLIAIIVNNVSDGRNVNPRRYPIQ